MLFIERVISNAVKYFAKHQIFLQKHALQYIYFNCTLSIMQTEQTSEPL